MNYLAIIELNLVVWALCLMIYSRNRKQADLEFLGDKIFNRMVLVLMCIPLLDAFSWSLPALGSRNYTLHMISECGYFLGQVYLSMLLLRYCIGINNKKIALWKEVLMRVPVTATLVMLAVNWVHPFAFRLLEDNRYRRMDDFLILNIWPMTYIVAAIGLCMWRYARADRHEKQVYGKLLMFISVCAAAGVVGSMFYGISIWPIIALDLLYLYLNVHSHREDELNALASRDGLTGLRNMAAYNHELKKLEKRIEGGEQEFAVVVIDINDLKNTNDHHGHKMGDRLILKVSGLICSIYGHSPVFRTGGDEFVVLLENADYRNRTALLMEFREVIASAHIEMENGVQLPVSAAVGMAEFDINCHAGYAQVYEAADRAMYADKERGRRRE